MTIVSGTYHIERHVKEPTSGRHFVSYRSSHPSIHPKTNPIIYLIFPSPPPPPKSNSHPRLSACTASIFPRPR